MANYKHIILDADELMSILGKQDTLNKSIDNSDVENYYSFDFHNSVHTNNSDYVLFYYADFETESHLHALSALEPGNHLKANRVYYTVIGGEESRKYDDPLKEVA